MDTDAYRYPIGRDPAYDRCVVIDDGETGDFWSTGWYQAPWGKKVTGCYDPVNKFKGSFGITLIMPGSPGDRSSVGFLARKAAGLKGMNALRMWVKPDGTGNRVSLGIQDFTNELWWITLPHMLSGTEPYILEVPLVELTKCQVIRRNNGIMDLDQFVSFFFWQEGGYSFSFDELLIVHDPALPEFDPLAARAPLIGKVYQVNCGGRLASEFSQDCFYGGDGITAWWNSTEDMDVTGAVDPAPQMVYQTCRCSAADTLTYTLPYLEPGGTYALRLHFCETIETAVGRRVQDIHANGVSVARKLDVIDEAGGPRKALVKEFQVAADSKGRIVLELRGVAGKAMINGIELVSPTPGKSPWSSR